MHAEKYILEHVEHVSNNPSPKTPSSISDGHLPSLSSQPEDNPSFTISTNSTDTGRHTLNPDSPRKTNSADTSTHLSKPHSSRVTDSAGFESHFSNPSSTRGFGAKLF